MATTKQKLSVIDYWLKNSFNPKAGIEQADIRCGRKFAVVTKDKEGRPTYWTDFLPIDTLQEVVRMLMNYNSFIKIKEA